MTNFSKLRRRANHGDVAAMRDLGFSLRESAENNLSEAFKWFIKAANFGDAKSFIFVGDMCLFGQGTPKSPQKALFCYRKVAENPYVSPQDRQLAENRIAHFDEIFSLETESDNHRARRILSDIFRDGKFGIKKNPELALELLANDAANELNVVDQIIALRKSAEVYREIDPNKAAELSREAEKLSRTWTQNFSALQSL